MKILLVNKNCWMGGVETLMCALAQNFRAAGHECELFFFRRGPMERFLPQNLTVHFGDLADLVRLVCGRGFDVVHANSDDWEMGVSLVRKFDARLVVTSHGWISPGWNSTNCDAVVACAAWLAAEQESCTDLPVQIVLNGIDTDKFKPATLLPLAPSIASPIIAWVGRGVAVEQKRIDKFALVAPALRQAGFRLRLVEPYGAQEVERCVPESARTLRSLAEFWGALPTEEMPAFYREVAASGGALLSTASYEGLPMTLLEAQGCACPVIGANVRGVNEAISQEHGGTLYEFGIEAESLARLVIETVNDREGMRRRGAACARRVEEGFSLERMAQDYLRVYEEAPYRRRAGLASVRARHHLSPLLNWHGYVVERWRPGNNLYEMSRALSDVGDSELAAAFARAALVMCPTLFARPERLAHLLKTRVGRGGARKGIEAA
jgi:glycosyltransferase involved in cell wall biosynthesis